MPCSGARHALGVLRYMVLRMAKAIKRSITLGLAAGLIASTVAVGSPPAHSLSPDVAQNPKPLRVSGLLDKLKNLDQKLKQTIGDQFPESGSLIRASRER